MQIPVATNAQTITVPNEDGVELAYNLVNDGTELEVAPKAEKYSGNITIPETVTVDGKTLKVTAIGKKAFEDNAELTALTMRNSIISIGDSAFIGCTSLKEINWGNAIRKIGSRSFRHCESLEEIILPNSVTEIGLGCFSSCYNLKKVQLSTSVEELQSLTFGSCMSLESITLGKSLRSIGSFAFGDCENLKELAMPDFVKTIERQAFSGCIRLSYLTLGKSLETIGEYAFNKINIDMIVFPSTMKEIQHAAFFECRNLKTVVCLGKTPPAVAATAFDNNTYENGTLYVPNGTFSKYRYTNYWSKFLSNIKTGVPVGIKGIKSKGKEGKNEYYSIDGRKLYGPEKGINIINGEKVLVK